MSLRKHQASARTSNCFHTCGRGRFLIAHARRAARAQAFPVHCVSTVAHPRWHQFANPTEANMTRVVALLMACVVLASCSTTMESVLEKLSIGHPHGWAAFLKMLHRGLARQNMTNFGGSRKLNSPATRAMTPNPNTARMKGHLSNRAPIDHACSTDDHVDPSKGH